MLSPDMEAVVLPRWWIGLGVAALGAAGLTVGWLIEGNGDNSAALAVMSALAVAAGSLLAATAGGEWAVRTTGGVLFLVGLGILVTQHEVWWWLPSDWVTPMSLTALVVSLTGFGVLLLAYGFRVAWLSGALGLLALTCLALTPVPYWGGNEQQVLQVFATAFGGAALTTGWHAFTARTRLDRRSTIGAASIAVLVTLYTGAHAYEHTPASYHAVVLGATVAGAAASLVTGAVSSGAAIAASLPRIGTHTSVPPAPQPAPTPSPPSPPKTQPSSPPPTEPPSDQVAPTEPATAVAATEGQSTARATATAPTMSRLQSASLIVGLAVGLITIIKEAVAAILTLVH